MCSLCLADYQKGPAGAVAAFSLEPEVQVGTVVKLQAFRYKADLHNGFKTPSPGC